VAQPTIARIERGQVDPRLGTLSRLLDACGWELAARPASGSLSRRAPSPRVPETPAERVAAVSTRSFEPARLLGALAEHGVDFVLIGALARVVAGDADDAGRVEVCADWDDANLKRLADVLRIVGARAADPDAGVFLADARSLAAGDRHDLVTTAGPITVLRRAGGLAFDRLARQAGAADPGSSLEIRVTTSA
jgi:hypothetical protein